MKKYLVELTGDERAVLQTMIRRGKTSARKVTRAHPTPRRPGRDRLGNRHRIGRRHRYG